MRDPLNEWLTALGTLTSGASAEEENVTKRTAFSSMLREEFDHRAFTHASLAYVARRCKFGFPKYAELCEFLSEWWQQNRPPVMALEGPPGEKDWRQVVAEERAEAERDWADVSVVRHAVVSLDDHPMRLILGRMLGALVMRHAVWNIPLVPVDFHPPEAQERLAQYRRLHTEYVP